MGIGEGIHKNSEGELSVPSTALMDELYCADDCPALLKEAIDYSAVWQVRNETSVEKAVSAPSLLPEFTLGLLAMDAEVLLEDGSAVPFTEYVNKSGKRGKMAALLVSEARPAATARLGVAPKSEPIVAVAASIQVEDGVVQDVCVAATGVWAGRKWLAESTSKFTGVETAKLDVDGVVAAIEGEVNPKGDYLGSAEYRRAMAGVLTRQALEACLKGAK